MAQKAPVRFSIAFVVVLAVVAVGAVVFVEMSRLRQENGKLKGESLSKEGALSLPGGSSEEVERLSRRVRELEMALAGCGSNTAKDTVTIPADPKSRLGRYVLLRSALRNHPELGIPEIELLNEADWLDAVRMAPKVDLDTEEGARRALAGLRTRAKMSFGSRLMRALKAYLDRTGSLPTDVQQLKHFLDAQRSTYVDIRSYEELAPPVEERVLASYTMGSLPGRTRAILVETRPVDAINETILRVSEKGLVLINAAKGVPVGFGYLPDGGHDPELVTEQEMEAEKVQRAAEAQRTVAR